MKAITLTELKKQKACKESIDFFKRNNLHNLDWSKVKEIEGDYNQYLLWWETSNQYTYTYDDKGNILTKTNKNGSVWKYTYDKNGNELSKILPDGNFFSWTYDDKNNKLSETLPGGRTTTWKYFFDRDNILYKITENEETIMEIIFDTKTGKI